MEKQIQILILDDEPIVGKRLGPALSKMGAEVEVFENSGKALERIQEKIFDIVVTDIRMDEISTALKSWKKSRPDQRTPR